MITSIWCYQWQRLRLQQANTDAAAAAAATAAAAAGWFLPSGLRRCCCRVNVTLFSRVTLIRKLQSTSDLDHCHARELPCSRVKSRNDPISGC